MRRDNGRRNLIGIRLWYVYWVRIWKCGCSKNGKERTGIELINLTRTYKYGYTEKCFRPALITLESQLYTGQSVLVYIILNKTVNNSRTA